MDDARTADGRLGPRLVVAGTHSGVGKTTVATGLLAALRRAGHRPAAAKVGPDFIDPGYHALACGRPPRNLDAWLCGEDAVAPLAGRAAAGADLLVVEGVMGLFDGSADGTPSSTADVARLLDAPVVLVVDAKAMSGSVAALVAGYAGFDPRVDVAGVVLNRVGSDGHETLLREALQPLGIPVLGALRTDDRLTWRDRHLGLVPVAEQPAAVAAALERLAAAVAERIDLDAVVRLAARAPGRTVAGVPVPPRVVPQGRTVRVAVAAGAAFTFTYTDTLDALAAAGIEVAARRRRPRRRPPRRHRGPRRGRRVPRGPRRRPRRQRAAAGRRARPGRRGHADVGRVRRAPVAVPHPRRGAARRRAARRGAHDRPPDPRVPHGSHDRRRRRSAHRAPCCGATSSTTRRSTRRATRCG